jgi:hypothetical protein
MPNLSTRFQWENAGWQAWEIFGGIVDIMQQAMLDRGMYLSRTLPRTYVFIRERLWLNFPKLGLHDSITPLA